MKQVTRASVQAELAPNSPPPFLQSAFEARAALDIATFPLSLGRAWLSTSRRRPKERRSTVNKVMTFPGYATTELSMRPLELFLGQHGYRCEGWGLGRNLAGSNFAHALDDLNERWELTLPEAYSESDYKGEGGVPYLCDRAIERVAQRVNDTGQAFALIGWSLGGYVAREVARALGPDYVSQVVTLCTPVIGGPRYTRAVSVFAAQGQDLDWIERAIAQQEVRPIEQPITAIYSKTDGVVNWRAMLDKFSPDVRHYQLNVSHLGVGFNRKAWRIVLQALEGAAQRTSD